MRFRICMNAESAKWEIKLSSWYAFGWDTLPKTFSSFYEAESWAMEQGLHEAYHYQDQRVMERLVSGAHQWQTNVTAQQTDNFSKMPSVVRTNRMQPAHAS